MLYPAELQAQILVERVMGIEPTQSAWKAEILPLNYTRSYEIDYDIIATIMAFVNRFFEKIIKISENFCKKGIDTE